MSVPSVARAALAVLAAQLPPLLLLQVPLCYQCFYISAVSGRACVFWNFPGHGESRGVLTWL